MEQERDPSFIMFYKVFVNNIYLGKVFYEKANETMV